MNVARRILLVAGFTGLCAASPALAEDPAVRALPVTGNAPQVCAIDSSSIRLSGLVNIRGSEGDTLQIVQLLDPATLAARPARAAVELEAVCNFPHRLRIESQNNGLWPIEGNLASARTDFATALPYQALVTWADRSRNLLADAEIRHPVESRMEVDDPASGQIRLEFTMDAGASNTRAFSPVLAGTYGDTVRIFLEPR